MLMQHTGFWQYLMTPVDVHYVPLHRLMSWLVYHVAPMNFSVAIAVLLAFHIGTLVFLARTLRLLQAGPVGGLILCGYAASAMIVYGLVWWAHAECRAPYVFMDVCAIYNYLAWMKDGRRARLFCMALAFVLAFGFYEKAVLIPVHLVLVGYLSDEHRFRSHAKAWLTPVAWMLLGALGYALGYLWIHRGAASSPPLQAIRADLEFAKVFFATASGMGAEDAHDVPEHGLSLRLLCVLFAGCVAVLWSAIRRRGSWKVLLAALLVVMLDFLPITLSNRGTWIGLRIMHQTRYGYEELHMFALLAGIWCTQVSAGVVLGVHRKVAWGLGFALVLAYAAVNIGYVRSGRQQPLGLLWMMDQSHHYLGNVRAGTAQLSGGMPVFQNDRVPHYLSLFWITPDTRTLLPLFLPHAKFDDTAVPRYTVLQDGRIVQLQ
ncbi:hypothetical protein [Dyella psychrodurans]|uniref:hypothetical protein n=1 Tax=Dyella psychrodurans TaxID=1927960 RepID=UPI0011C03BF8|nr:hypothetical protein [Dyella psychrodurans]